MKRILFAVAMSFMLNISKARAEIQVIQVRRNIPLADDEPVFKDYYLSGGKQTGLRQNLVVPVWRWVNLRENNQAQDQSLKILEPVGWLKVIFVQDQLAVARLYEPVDSNEMPVLEQPGIMMGDIISLEQSYMAKPNRKTPKDSSQNPVPSVRSESVPSGSTVSSSEAPPAALSPTAPPAVTEVAALPPHALSPAREPQPERIEPEAKPAIILSKDSPKLTSEPIQAEVDEKTGLSRALVR